MKRTEFLKKALLGGVGAVVAPKVAVAEPENVPPPNRPAVGLEVVRSVPLRSEDGTREEGTLEMLKAPDMVMIRIVGDDGIVTADRQFLVAGGTDQFEFDAYAHFDELMDQYAKPQIEEFDVALVFDAESNEFMQVAVSVEWKVWGADRISVVRRIDGEEVARLELVDEDGNVRNVRAEGCAKFPDAAPSIAHYYLIAANGAGLKQEVVLR